MTRRIFLENVFLTKLVETVEKVKDQLIGLTIEDNNDFWQKIENTPAVDPNSEELLCWNCALYPLEYESGIPLFSYTDIVKNYQSNYELHHNLFDSINTKEIRCEKYMGHFCSIFCKISHLNTTAEIPEHDKERCRKMIYYNYGMKVGRRVAYIPPAHPRYRMKTYCGSAGWSQQEYREKNKLLEHLIIFL